MNKKILSSKKEIVKECFVPFLLELLILGVMIGIFYLFINSGPLLQEPKMVGDEMSSPTLGRLVYLFISFFAFIVLAILASKSSKKGNDTKAFWCGYIAGIALWQSIGEAVWHFSVGGINFTPLENVTTFPIAVVICMLFIYGKKNHSFDWGIFILFVSFMCNWMGHYITIGIYPFFSLLIDRKTWILVMSLIVGIIALVLSIKFLLFRAKTKRGRMVASLFIYISIAIIVFGII